MKGGFPVNKPEFKLSYKPEYSSESMIYPNPDLRKPVESVKLDNQIKAAQSTQK